MPAVWRLTISEATSERTVAMIEGQGCLVRLVDVGQANGKRRPHTNL